MSVKWLLALALTLPASAQAPGGGSLYDILKQSGVPYAPYTPGNSYTDILRTISGLEQLSSPYGYAIPDMLNGIWPQLVNGQFTLPSGTQSFSPSPLPGDSRLPIEMKLKDLPGQPVENYACMSSGGYPCRFPSDKLPLKVYSALPERRHLVDKSIAVWNDSSRKSLKTDLFCQVTDPLQAQIKVDWAGINVPKDAAGVTPIYIWSNRVQIGEISILDKSDFKDTDYIAILSHELGHSLGLDHSKDPSDLMYTHHTIHSAHGNALTQRDSWMLGWLYSQKTAIPLVF